ncbi:MAG TPA: glycosyltransferase [Kofleriaceae bacterium]|nr:glycosyltransferase [Kofleriaceae bacterium]
MASFPALLVYSLALVVLLNRYAGGILLRRRTRGTPRPDPALDDEVDDTYQPLVEVVVPMFNEGEGIRDTIASLIAQTYPAHKLKVTIADDCSTDDSYQQAVAAASGKRNVRVQRMPRNMGKRRAINRVVRKSRAEIIVSVDSDVVVDRDAIRQLVRRFVSPRIAAVGGRVDIRNKHQNWLTRMQTIKYFFGYSFLKSRERSYRSVLCLSGCLTAYRRSVLLELERLLENRSVLGVPIKYGEDRFLTRQIVKAGYQTTMTHDAVCKTYAPASLDSYFAQQLRWRRSNLIDYVSGLSHVWRLHPVVAIQYFTLFSLLLAYPVLVLDLLRTGAIFKVLTVHCGVMAACGFYYRWHVRHLPAEEKVSAISLAPIAAVITVTYGILTVVALFTLDCGKWETRRHEAADDEPALEPTTVPFEPVSSGGAGEPATQVASAKVRAA